MARSSQSARDDWGGELDLRTAVALRYPCRATGGRRLCGPARSMELPDGPLAPAAGVRGLTSVVRDAASGKWRLFERPREIIVAHTVADVLPALERIEDECAREQRFAAGFLSYEAAPAFDPALKTQASDDFPLLWFGLYDRADECSLDALAPAAGDLDRRALGSVDLVRPVRSRVRAAPGADTKR